MLVVLIDKSSIDITKEIRLFHILLQECEQSWRQRNKMSRDKKKGMVSLIFTLFEIFIFCLKIQLWFPEKIVELFWVKNSWKCCGFRLFAVENFDFTRKFVKTFFSGKTRENVGVLSKLDKNLTVRMLWVFFFFFAFGIQFCVFFFFFSLWVNILVF